MTMNEHQLAVYEAEVRAYNTVIELIDRMMEPEPYADLKKDREWEKDTRTLRALKCDVLQAFIRADGMRAYNEKQVAEDHARAEEERKKNEG